MTERVPELGSLPGLRLFWGLIGGMGLALVAFVVIGLALPGTWTVERAEDMGAPADAVFPLLADLDAWELWTHWPELQGRTDGPASGIGASISWDDPQYGSGVLTITDVVPASLVAYEVAVDGGAIQIRGRLSVESVAGGTRVTWREDGDFGWNPLLAYMALTMDRMQGTELEKSLARLAELAVQRGRPPSTPNPTDPTS